MCKIKQAETPEYLKSPYTKEDFDQDSMAVCVAGDDPSAGMVLWWDGAWLDREINVVGQGLTLENLQLHEAPAGVSIWTGRYVYETHDSPEYGVEHDYEAVGDFRELTPAEWVAFMNGDNPLEAPPEEVVVIDVTIVKPTRLEKINLKITLEHEKPVAVYYRGLLTLETTEERHGDYHWLEDGETPVFEDDFGLLRDRDESDIIPCLVVVWSGDRIDRYHRVNGAWLPANGDIPWPPSMGRRLSAAFTGSELAAAVDPPVGTWAGASECHVVRDIAEVKPLIEAAFGPTVRERLVKLYGERGQLEIDMDGPAWCAKFADFTNLMESPCGFGDTPEEALSKLYEDVRKHELEGPPKPVERDHE